MCVRKSFTVACVVALLGFTGVALAADKPEDAAQAAAEAWLRLVDGGNYPASWDQAARALKDAVRQAEWSRLAGAERTPLGRLVSRKLRSREYTEKAPTTRVVGGKVYTWGSGKYVVIQYDSVFANRASVVETVTPMVDPDGAWRVSGYSLR
jgi:Protein of unknown function (DUF4019)